MQLTHTQLRELDTLIRAAFPSRSELMRLTLYELGENLDELAPTTNLNDAVLELIRWAQAHDRLADLLQAAVAANPDNTGLRAFVAQVSSTLTPSTPNPAPTPSLTLQARRDLRKLLAATYTTEAQVRDLCVDLGIAYRQLDGEDLPSRLASLLLTAERQGQAADLAAAAREEAAQQAARQAQEAARAEAARQTQEAARAEATRQAQEAARVEAARQGRQQAARAEAEQQVREWAARAEADRRARELAAQEEAERQTREQAARWEEAAQRSFGGIYSVAFTPDGEIFAIGTSDNTIQICRVGDGSLLQTLTEHYSYVRSIAFAPNGQCLASGSDDGRVRLWRVADGSLLQTLTGHTSRVFSIAFAPDGQLLASGSNDGTVRLWRVADGILWHRLGKPH